MGNLPFDCQEETLREHMAACGDVLAVRIVRDPEENMGKGFGYVLFAERPAVERALQLHGTPINGREVRVFRCRAPGDQTLRGGRKAPASARRGQPQNKPAAPTGTGRRGARVEERPAGPFPRGSSPEHESVAEEKLKGSPDGPGSGTPAGDKAQGNGRRQRPGARIGGQQTRRPPR